MPDPPDSVLQWAAAAHGAHSTVVSATGLRDNASPWRLQIATPDGPTEVILRAPGGPWGRVYIATGVAALKVAEQHGLSAPRLIAEDIEGHEAGRAASIETVLPGESGWPPQTSTPRPPETWTTAGAALARIHRVPLEPQDHLPVRVRPIEYDDFALQRRWGAFYRASTEDERPEVVKAFVAFANWPEAAARRIGTVPSSPLLHLADEVVRRHERPRVQQVFLHGDVWCGNVMWTGDTCVGLIDWKTAGVGDPGVDIGNLRFQASLRHSRDAAELVLQGWEEESGRKATDVAYWDAVAALNTRTYSDQVDGAKRRDAFLRAALTDLGA